VTSFFFAVSLAARFSERDRLACHSVNQGRQEADSLRKSFVGPLDTIAASPNIAKPDRGVEQLGSSSGS
jgi:hypothetical protein